jgi:hypothetical protein
MPAPLDLTGERFGRLVALHPAVQPRRGKARRWLCQCDCGELAAVETSALTKGHTRSCGCLQREAAAEATAALAAATVPRDCPRCGAAFGGRLSRSVYCSAACEVAARRQREREATAARHAAARCRDCGAALQVALAGRSGQPPRTCPACKRRRDAARQRARRQKAGEPPQGGADE